jgi:Ca-activated chloride channel family protein
MLRYPRPLVILTFAILFSLFFFSQTQTPPAQAASPGETPGSLTIVGKNGKPLGACPLQHTDVHADIAGFVTRVTVTQIFQNSAAKPIEAVYTFPLPEEAAVDDMTIQVGTRTVRGLIKPREEAQKIYQKAIRSGRTAALLDQERPNIFTHTVGNIPPGEEVRVTISYLETLHYEAGSFEFVFPMVVAPRYIPGDPTGHQGGGWAPDTTQVPDASRVTPPVAVPGTRAGHDISVEVTLDSGVALQEVRSRSHDVDIEHTGASSAVVRLRNQAEIPNKDFILNYDVAGTEIGDAILTHWASTGSKAPAAGYFTFILQPPARFPESDVAPKELVFVLDTSGSMSGFPIEKAKEVIDRALDGLYPGDTFNLITFSGDTSILFPEPVFPTAENIRKARAFLQSRSGNGGTEMMKAIRAALAPSDSQDHVRVVCFLTDGEVGNDMDIIAEVKQHPNARVFAFGIGTSVNRFLLSKMAEEGRGAVEFVTLADKAEPAAQRFYERIRSPLLTDVALDFGDLPVTDVLPRRIPDLFSGQPVIITGRYARAASGTLRLRGKRAGDPFVREIPVTFAQDRTANSLLATVWARRQVDDLMSQDWNGMQSGQPKPALRAQITQLGLDYRLMTQFTSFVAVEDRVVNKDGKPVHVDVPVEMPEGMSYEGVFGDEKSALLLAPNAGLTMYEQMGMASKSARVSSRMIGVGTGSGTGSAGGVAGGVVTRGALQTPTKLPSSVPAPPPPPPSMSTRTTVSVEPAEIPPTIPPHPSDPARALLESKLHPSVLAAFDCSQKSGATGPGCDLIHSGKLELQIWLKTDSPQILDHLKALGLDLTRHHASARSVEGAFPVEKLPALAQLEAVRFVVAVHH